MSHCKEKVQLVVALLVAGLFSDLFSAVCWQRIFRAGKFLIVSSTRGSVKASDTLYFHRLFLCRRCPIFYHRLKTCGTPLDRQLKEAGCWCHQPTAARLLDKTCWIDDELGGDSPHGWHENKS